MEYTATSAGHVTRNSLLVSSGSVHRTSDPGHTDDVAVAMVTFLPTISRPCESGAPGNF